MLKGYGVTQDGASSSMTLNYDNLSVINIPKNPVQHSRTNHIDIKDHFIIILVEDKVIEIKHIPTNRQLADIITKRLDVFRFETLRSSLGLCVL